MKLLDIPKGTEVIVTDFAGGKGVSHKLRQLGICPGKKVKVLRFAPLGGPVMVDVEGRSIAIGRGIAAKVKVEAS
jgi:ferrous iron transport protein A